MDFSTYTIKSPEEALEELTSSQKNGLSQREVEQRQKQYGSNLIQARIIHWWQILIRQFSSSFVYLLLVAATLAFLLREYLDGSMILLFVGINALLGFYQEYRSEQTVRLLKKYLLLKVRVRRDGQETLIDGLTLVPGDIVILQVGDIIPADVRLLTTQNLLVDESVLTGESFPVKKKEAALHQKIEAVHKAENIGFSGTTVVEGKAEGIVVATGKKTIIGGVTKLTLETERESSFEKAIRQLSRLILFLVLITLTLVFLSHLFIKSSSISVFELLLFSIALAVSVIPEALPVVMTFSLSRGALRLAKNKVVVKRLSAIEDLGSIEVLCADKTGTLTENSLSVASIYGDQTEACLFYANLAGYVLADQKEPSTNAFDKAIWQKTDPQQREALTQYNKVSEIPFDSQRRRDTVLVEHGQGYELVVRGAPEVLMGFAENLNQQQKQKLNHWIVKEGEEGRRVLGIAKLTGIKSKNYKLNQDDKNLTFLGLISFMDPIKKTTLDAVKKAQQLGIEIKILTGDRKEVAGAVAMEVGLIQSPKAVITGEAFNKLSPAAQVKAVHQYQVFARVTPQQKYNIIQLLEKDKEVGFLGEGINDAPALKAANVALVVQGAADIAREAADIVLLKKSLAVIIDGVKEGREVFANTIKYIKTTLASNFGNFYAIAIASLLIDYLPLLPLQILLLNLLSDFPMIAIATDNVSPEDLLQPKKYQIKDLGIVSMLLGAISSVFDFLFFWLFVRYGPDVLRTNWFIGSVLTELILIFSLRTRFFSFKAKRPSFSLFSLAVGAALITIILAFTDFGQRVFSFLPPSPRQLGIILFIVLLYFATTESAKLLYYRIANSHQKNYL
jgi:Mg2+-importing ATPase